MSERKPHLQVVMHPRWRDGVSVMADIKEVTLDGRPMLLIDPGDSRSVAIEVVQAVGSALNLMPGRDLSAGIAAAQHTFRKLAKPPHIDEPGTLGVVEASCVHGDWRTQWIHDEDGNWYPFGHNGLSTTKNPDDWDSLVDPVLIREGVTP